MKHDTRLAVWAGNNIETEFGKTGDVIFHESDQTHELFVIVLR